MTNFGAKSLSISGIEAMYKGRGSVATAFTTAAQDLNAAIKQLSDKQKDKIFKNGKKFMSIEVIDSKNPNVINYGFSELRFHGTIEYDEKGNPVSQLNKEDGRILGGMIDQIRASKQSTFDIKSLPKLKMKKLPNYSLLKSKFVSDLKSIMKEYNLSANNTISDYTRAFWERIIDKQYKSISSSDRETLIQRWAFGVKQPNIRQLKKQIPDEDISLIEKQHKTLQKDMMDKFEQLFLKLGVEVIKGMSTFLSVNPKYTNDKMKKDLEDAISKVGKTDNPQVAKRLADEINRFKSIGGSDAVMHTEGITFFYRG